MAIISNTTQKYFLNKIIRTWNTLEFLNNFFKLILLLFSYNIFFNGIKAIFALSLSNNYGIPFVDLFIDSDINTNSYIAILVFTFIIISIIPASLHALIYSKRSYKKSYVKIAFLCGFIAYCILSIKLVLALESMTGYVISIIISIISILLIAKILNRKTCFITKIIAISIFDKKIRLKSYYVRNRMLNYFTIILFSCLFYSLFIILVFYLAIIGQENIIVDVVNKHTPSFLSKDTHAEIYTFFLLTIPLIIFFANYSISVIFFSKNIFLIAKIIILVISSTLINIALISYLAGNFFYIVNRHLFMLNQGGGMDVQIVLGDEIYKIHPSLRLSYKSNISKPIKLLIKTDRFTFISSCEVNDFVIKIDNNDQDKIIIYSRKNKNIMPYCPLNNE